MGMGMRNDYLASLTFTELLKELQEGWRKIVYPVPGPECATEELERQLREATRPQQSRPA